MVNAVKVNGRDSCSPVTGPVFCIMGGWPHGARVDGSRRMYRVIAIVGGALRARGVFIVAEWRSALQAGTEMETVRFESEPPGAEAKTSNGQTCRTPCALALPAKRTARRRVHAQWLPAGIRAVEPVSAGDNTNAFAAEPGGGGTDAGAAAAKPVKKACAAGRSPQPSRPRRKPAAAKPPRRPCRR